MIMPDEVAVVLIQQAYNAQAWAREALIGAKVLLLTEHEGTANIKAKVVSVHLCPTHGLLFKVVLQRKDGTLEELPKPVPTTALGWDQHGYNVEDLHEEVLADVLWRRLDPEEFHGTKKG